MMSFNLKPLNRLTHVLNLLKPPVISSRSQAQAVNTFSAKFSTSSHSTAGNHSPNPNSSKDHEVLFHLNSNGVASIHLNRPKALNALNLNMCNTINRHLTQWKSENHLRSVIITGEGSKAFCAGGDIRSISSPPEPGWSERFFASEYLMNNSLSHYAVPVISILNGIFMGGGVGISVHGDFRIVTKNSVFAMPETGIGLFPDVGGSYFLPRLKGKVGVFAALTGARLNAADCLYSGIATHYMAPDAIPLFVKKLNETHFTHSHHKNSRNLLKNEIGDIINSFSSQPPSDLISANSIEQNIDLINQIFGYDSYDQILNALNQLANQNKNDHQSQWAANIISTLSTKSITSILISLEAVLRGYKYKNLAEALNTEYRLACRIVRKNGDFKEGVRALIIDKDNKPKWANTPNREEILSYFQPFHPSEHLQELIL